MSFKPSYSVYVKVEYQSSPLINHVGKIVNRYYKHDVTI